MIDGKTNTSIGQPSHEGIYSVEIYCGWKLLEWYKSEWWFPQRHAKWGADIPARWVGPMPGSRTVPVAAQDFDL